MISRAKRAQAFFALRLLLVVYFLLLGTTVTAAPLEQNEFLADHAQALYPDQRKTHVSALSYLAESERFQLGVIISADANLAPDQLPGYAESALQQWRPEHPDRAVMLVIHVPTKRAYFAVGAALRQSFPEELLQHGLQERVQWYLDHDYINLAVDRARNLLLDMRDGHVPADLLQPPASPARPLYQRIAPGGPMMLLLELAGFVALMLWLMNRYVMRLPLGVVFGIVGAASGTMAWVLQMSKPWPVLIAFAVGCLPLTQPASTKVDSNRWRARAGSGTADPSGVGGTTARSAGDKRARVRQQLLRGRLPGSPRYSQRQFEAVKARIAEAATSHAGAIAFSTQVRLSLATILRGESSRDAAREAFVTQHVWNTPLSNGVLIHVIEAERSLEIIADRGIAQRVSAARWDAVRSAAEAALASDDFERAAMLAVEGVAALLREAFPR